MLRTFGKTTAKLRAMAGDFQKQFNEALKEAELDDVKKSVDELRSLNPAARSASSSIRSKRRRPTSAPGSTRLKPDAAPGDPAGRRSTPQPAEPLKEGRPTCLALAAAAEAVPPPDLSRRRPSQRRSRRPAPDCRAAPAEPAALGAGQPRRGGRPKAPTATEGGKPKKALDGRQALPRRCRPRRPRRRTGRGPKLPKSRQARATPKARSLQREPHSPTRSRNRRRR